jgi:hypothetical protein
MKSLKKCLVKRSLALVLTAALAWLVTGPAFLAAEESEENFCFQVLKKCFGDAILYGFLTRGIGFVVYMTYCLVGYDFCMKYVDQCA